MAHERRRRREPLTKWPSDRGVEVLAPHPPAAVVFPRGGCWAKSRSKKRSRGEEEQMITHLPSIVMLMAGAFFLLPRMPKLPR
jgi:hypothetical protein